jgi:hypothetical protein
MHTRRLVGDQDRPQAAAIETASAKRERAFAGGAGAASPGESAAAVGRQ